MSGERTAISNNSEQLPLQFRNVGSLESGKNARVRRKEIYHGNLDILSRVFAAKDLNVMSISNYLLAGIPSANFAVLCYLCGDVLSFSLLLYFTATLLLSWTNSTTRSSAQNRSAPSHFEMNPQCPPCSGVTSRTPAAFSMPARTSAL